MLKSTMEKVITKEFNISKESIKISEDGQMTDILDNVNIPDTIAINITTTEQNMKKIDEADIIIYVEMQDYKNNPSNVKLKVEPLDNVQSIEIKPLYLNLEG